MGKRIGAVVLNQALNYISANANKVVVCSAEPTTYAEANATYALASTSLTSGDFTVADGDTGGNTPRKITLASKTSTVTTSGTMTHIAVLNTTGSELLYVTTTNSVAIVATNPITFPAFELEISAPA